MMPQPHQVKPFQITAGRALLGWSISDLSSVSGVSVASIRRAEAAIDESPLKPTDTLKLLYAMGASGVVFTRDLSRIGVALDLRKR